MGPVVHCPLLFLLLLFLLAIFIRNRRCFIVYLTCCNVQSIVLFYFLDLAEKIKSISRLNILTKFFLEKDKGGRLPFLDINIFRENGKFATNIYRKKAFSCV